MSTPPTAPQFTLILVGPHGAGKTTIARRVAYHLGWTFHDEIGDGLRRVALARRADAHAQTVDLGFDIEVTRRELARDAASAGPRVIETWHPGNLAYVGERNPRLARRLGPRLERAARLVAARGPLLVQPLVIARPTAVARRSEPGPDSLIDFFLRVGARASELARGWGLEVATPIHTDRATVDEAVQAVVSSVHHHGRGHQEACR